MAPLKTPSRVPFNPAQRKVLLALACTVGLRMLGLFLVLPVFTLYGLQLTSSGFWVGFAFGAYALTMGLLQIPYGRWSDRVGRRRVLIVGTIIFSLGSILCAAPPWFPQGSRISILIVGRLIQGGGAIISTAFAAVADHFELERRSTAMAVLGIPIGIAAAIGVVGGPIIAGLFNTTALFWATGILGFGSLWLLARYLPDVAPQSTAPAPWGEVLRGRSIVALSFGGFLMNFFMSTFFFFFPLIMRDQHHVKMTHYSAILLPMMLVSGITMFGFSRGADRGWGRPLAALAFLMFLPYAVFLFRPEMVGFDPHRLTSVVIAGTIFYIAFTGLEPVLPSLVSKFAPGNSYGTALGFYNTTQFLGSAVGGPLAGALSRHPSTTLMVTLIAASLAGAALMWVKPKS